MDVPDEEVNLDMGKVRTPQIKPSAPQADTAQGESKNYEPGESQYFVIDKELKDHQEVVSDRVIKKYIIEGESQTKCYYMYNGDMRKLICDSGATELLIRRDELEDAKVEKTTVKAVGGLVVDALLVSSAIWRPDGRKVEVKNVLAMERESTLVPNTICV
jgi:hypothetical protein